MISLILLLPFCGFFFSLVFGRFLGKGTALITVLNIFLTFLLSCYLFFDIVSTNSIHILNGFNWIFFGPINIVWGLYIDSLTVIMLLVVTFVSTIVHLYSVEYMSEDPHFQRFMSYLSLFTFFMLILITSTNFLQMFVGWEGVGLSSYLLINFWFTRLQANKSAIKAMLLNRIGDFFILLALFLIYFLFESFDYAVIFNMASDVKDLFVTVFNININLIDLICICLLLGAMGKSAQLGLHTWLPDAMEGPTPVSALIHAATMVTAGVFLISRCSYLFELAPTALNCTALVGSLTAFFGASTGLFQNDIKKIIAYSTCSQLGYMIFACGLSGYSFAIFHLYNHAFFKALLFLGAGAVIHSIGDEQDIRKMGGLISFLPFSYVSFLVGSLALIGFPFFSGFYSKDAIIEAAFATQTSIGLFCYFLGVLVAFLTAFYSTRLLCLVFLAEPNSNKQTYKHIHESSVYITIALFLLLICSVVIGFLSYDLFIGMGSDFWQSSLYFSANAYVLHDIEFLDFTYKIFPLIFTLLGITFASALYQYNLSAFLVIKKTRLFLNIYSFFIKKWYLDRLYNSIFSVHFLKFGYFGTYLAGDRGLIEILGPFGITQWVNNISKKVSTLQFGVISLYFFTWLILIIGLLFILFVSFYYNKIFIVSLFFGLLSILT